MTRTTTIVVGAGLAGLTCAKVVAAAGHPVMVLEARSQVGGRVRTERIDDFTLDVGFQVLFTRYPQARKHLDLAALDLRAFDSGAILQRGVRRSVVRNPFRHPGGLLRDLLSPALTPLDKVRLAHLSMEIHRTSITALRAWPDDRSLMEELQARGFSSRFIANLAQPFFGGIVLDRDLNVSARVAMFVLKMLAEGETVLPAQGMGAIAEQLATSLPPGSVRHGVRVAALLREDDHVAGVRATDGTEFHADQVVIATDAPAAAALTSLPLPMARLGVTQVCFASPVSLYPERLLVLNAAPDAFVNDAAQLSSIVPEYAPADQHLLSCTVLGDVPPSDDVLVAGCRTDLARWFGAERVMRLRPLAVRRIAYAQPRQLPGSAASKPSVVTDQPGLLLAGDYTDLSSIEGAMRSGEAAARQIIHQGVVQSR
jgi:phytoene dehydrogenase-like protein